MRVTIQIPDDLYEHFVQLADKHSRRPTSVISDVLKLLRDADPYDRVLVLPREHRAELERILSGGHLQSPRDLVEKVRALAGISMEGIELRFTPGQKRELKRIATRQGISYQEIVKRTVKGMEEMFFNVAH